MAIPSTTNNPSNLVILLKIIQDYHEKKMKNVKAYTVTIPYRAITLYLELSCSRSKILWNRRNVVTHLLLTRNENIAVYKSFSWEQKTERKSQMTDRKLTRTWQMKEVEEESSPRWSSSSLILWLLQLRVLFKHWFQFHSQYPVGLSGDWEDTSRQYPSACFKNHRLSLYKHLF